MGSDMWKNCLYYPQNDIEQNSLESSDLKGGIFCLTKFGTKLTHVPRQNRTKNRKQKLQFRKNCFAIVFSDLLENR